VHIFEFIYFGLSLLFAPLMASVQFAFWEKVNSFRANGWQPMQASFIKSTHSKTMRFGTPTSRTTIRGKASSIQDIGVGFSVERKIRTNSQPVFPAERH
jgi:hypothetical protein